MDNIFERDLLVVTAHPDDESFLAVGAISACLAAGCRVFLYCATRGEKGSAYLSAPLEPQELGQLRTRELERAAAHLGIQHLDVGNAADGAVSASTEDVASGIERVLRLGDARVVVSFGPAGVTRHRDHIAIGTVAERIATREGIAFVSFCPPPVSTCSDFHECFLAKRKHGVYQGEAEDRVSTHTLSVDSAHKTKALSLHESQFAGINPHAFLGRTTATHILETEYYHVQQ